MFEQIVPECRNSPCGCDVADFLELIQNIINFLVYFSTLVMVLLLVYVGFLYVTSATNPANRSKAKSLAISAVIGFVVVLGGFLIVSTVMNTFAKDEFGDWKSFFNAERQGCEMNEYVQDPTPNIIRGDDSELATKLNIICSAAAASNLRAVYEVRGRGEAGALREEGVRCPISVVPQITANHFSVYNSAGCQSEVVEESCPDCVTVPGVNFKDGNQVAQSYATQLLRMKGFIEDQQREFGSSFNWRVTEAFPPTVNHFCGCHRNGTCTDVNLF